MHTLCNNIGIFKSIAHCCNYVNYAGPEPILHSQAELDDFIARTQGGPHSHSHTESSHLTGACLSDDITRESTGVKVKYCEKRLRSHGCIFFYLFIYLFFLGGGGGGRGEEDSFLKRF